MATIVMAAVAADAVFSAKGSTLLKGYLLCELSVNYPFVLCVDLVMFAAAICRNIVKLWPSSLRFGLLVRSYDTACHNYVRLTVCLSVQHTVVIRQN